jgi:hypothetical protein
LTCNSTTIEGRAPLYAWWKRLRKNRVPYQDDGKQAGKRIAQRHNIIHAAVEFGGRLSRLYAPYDSTDTAKHCTNSTGNMHTSQPHARATRIVCCEKENRIENPVRCGPPIRHNDYSDYVAMLLFCVSEVQVFRTLDDSKDMFTKGPLEYSSGVGLACSTCFHADILRGSVQLSEDS